LTDTEEAALLLQRSPGGVETLPEKQRAVVEGIHDEQLQRAEDLLKGLILYNHLAADKPAHMAAK
jgi:hypothetical protein